MTDLRSDRHLPHAACCGISRRGLLVGAAAGAALGGLTGCVGTNPATGRTSFTGVYSLEDDIRIGREEHPRLLKQFGGEYEHPRLNSYVARIGQELASYAEYPQLPYRFTILNSPIVNAFALPGGYVYISRGLLALGSNEAELAGVLAHEIGHVNARHTAERLTAAQAAQFGLILGAIGAQMAGLPGDVVRVGETALALAIQGYSREQELEADTLGVRYMSRAGYDPDAMATFLSSLREQSQVEAQVLGLPPGQVDKFNAMATHPRTIDRVRQAQAAAQVQLVADPRVAPEDYFGHIDGMLFGDDPKEGVVVGRRFAHPALGIAFTVPEGYHIRNMPDRVIASSTGQDSIIFDMDSDPDGIRDVRDYLVGTWAARRRLNDVERIRIDERQAATGWFDDRGKQGPVRLRLIAIRRSRTEVYRFLLITRVSALAEQREGLRKMTYGFEHLSDAEIARIRALRLLIVPAMADDRVAVLARPLPYGDFNEAWFRVMNDLGPEQALEAGRLIKVIAS